MKTKFVAEVSSNHNNDLERSKDFIKKAAQIGCDAVKFQLFKIDKLFSSEILSKSAEHRKRRTWELSEELIPELADYAHKLGIEFSCTPFYLEAVDILAPYVDFFKIASYELLWEELFVKIAKTNKPVVFSTGMANMDEIRKAYNLLKKHGVEDITILHCVSSYPADIENCNLKAIDLLRDEFDCKIGWSDHTVSTAVLTRAVHRYQAQFVEFHIDLDTLGEEYDAGHCWLPDEMENFIALYKKSLLADGESVKEPTDQEMEEREWRADPSDGLRPFKHIRETWEGFTKK